MVGWETIDAVRDDVRLTCELDVGHGKEATVRRRCAAEGKAVCCVSDPKRVRRVRKSQMKVILGGLFWKTQDVNFSVI